MGYLVKEIAMNNPIIWCAMFCSGIAMAHADIVEVSDANVLTISNRTTHVRALPKT